MKWVGGVCELSQGERRLYLVETAAGELFLYFFSPWSRCNQNDACRLDVSDFGKGAVASFIATLFASCGLVSDYVDGLKIYS